MTPKETFETATQLTAGDILMRRGDVLPMLMAIKKGVPNTILVDWLYEDKPKLGKLIANVRQEVDFLAFACRLWEVSLTADEVKKQLTREEMRNHPSKKEVVSIIFYHGTEVWCKTAYITRIEGCSPTLGPWDNRNQTQPVTGPLVQPVPEWN